MQILALIYISIYKAEKPSICLSVTPLTCLGLLTMTYQLPNTINSSSSYFQICHRVLMQWSVVFCRELKTKKWRKLKQHSIKNHTDFFFFENQYFLETRFFFKFNFDSAVIWHSKHGTWAKLNARHLGTRICWLLIDSCFFSFFTVHWRHWYWTAVVHSCQTT